MPGSGVSGGGPARRCPGAAPAVGVSQRQWTAPGSLLPRRRAHLRSWRLLALIAGAAVARPCGRGRGGRPGARGAGELGRPQHLQDREEGAAATVPQSGLRPPRAPPRAPPNPALCVHAPRGLPGLVVRAGLAPPSASARPAGRRDLSSEPAPPRAGSGRPETEARILGQRRTARGRRGADRTTLRRMSTGALRELVHRCTCECAALPCPPDSRAGL